MADQFYSLLSTRFRVQCETAEVAARLHRLLGLFATSPGPVRGRRHFALASDGEDGGECRLLGDCQFLLGSSTWQPLVGALITELNREALEGCDQLAVHAGAVLGSGGVIAFPAPSGAGKSTLTAACVGVGFDYVSDEALCVTYDTGSVIPYPKPLALSRWSRRELGLSALDEGEQDEVMIAPDEVGTVAPRHDHRLGHVVLLDRRPGAPLLEEAPRSEAMATLLRMSFNHYKHPGQAVHLASRLANGARAWRLAYDEPLAAAALLHRQLG